MPTWSMAPHASDITFNNQTIRMIVRTTVGGSQVRIRVANQFGSDPLTIGGAHVALLLQGSTIVPGTDRALAFSGQPTVVIPPGAYALSDPADLDVPQLSDLAVSIYASGVTSGATAHKYGLKTTYISPQGDFTGAAELPAGTKTQSYYWLTEVYVASKSRLPVVVAFGDSITDGYGSTPDANRSWPSVLSKLLLTQSRHPEVVLNEGISGNRILFDGFGTSGLARFDRDALDQLELSAVILFEGINDITDGPRSTPNTKLGSQLVTPNQIIQAMQQIIARCRLHHIKIIGATLTPYAGSKYFSSDGDSSRKDVNNWIRTSGAFDAVLDFDKLVEDPAHLGHLLAAFDCGDHLHPDDAGYQAMATSALQILERLGK